MLLRVTLLVAVCLAVLPGCSAAKLTGRPPILMPNDRGEARTVVIEPFFEDADWKDRVRTENVRSYSAYGPVDYTVSQHYSEKPAWATVPALAEEQRRVISELHKLRPAWQVISTADLTGVNGPVSMVRVILGPGELVASNRTIETLAFVFGFVIPPLFLFEINPVEETQRVTGTVQRFDADAADLRPRRVRYQSQPDFAVDTRGLSPANLPFGIEFEYDEALFASEVSRTPALLRGVSQRVAAVVVTLVEGGH